MADVEYKRIDAVPKRPFDSEKVMSMFDGESSSMTLISTCGVSTCEMSSSSEPSSPCDRQPCSDPEAGLSTGSSLGGEKSLLTGQVSRKRHRRHRRRSTHAKQARSALESKVMTAAGSLSPRAARRRRVRALRRVKLAGDVREWRSAMAPRNSNEFLIADHGIETPSFLRSPVSDPAVRVDSSVSEEDFCFFDSASSEGEFEERNFAEMYDQLHAESLNDLRHAELVSRCLELEDEVAMLKQKTEQLQSQCSSNTPSDTVLSNLTAGNDSLKKENGLLLEIRRKSNDCSTECTVEQPQC